MAGIAELCTHVGALLFKIEAAVQIRGNKTVTDVPAYWMMPTNVDKVQGEVGYKIDFSSGAAKKVALDKCISEEIGMSGIRTRLGSTSHCAHEPTLSDLSPLLQCTKDFRYLNIIPMVSLNVVDTVFRSTEKSMMPFAIVDFLDGGGVAVVPCKWFTGPEEDACYWPPGRVNISKAVKEEVVPNSDWPQFKVRILGKAGNYAHATSKLRKSEVTSDLQTESDSGGNLGKGKRKKRAMILSSSDEDSDGAGHDRPPSSVPLLPPVPEICQPEAPQVAVVADIGGSTVDEATRRMMTFLLDHSLSREYNFVGRHGKREFRGLRLFEVMYGSLKKNALTNQITRKDAEKAVSKWLIGARDGGGTEMRGPVLESKMETVIKHCKAQFALHGQPDRVIKNHFLNKIPVNKSTNCTSLSAHVDVGIVNGRKAKPHSRPYMVSVQLEKKVEQNKNVKIISIPTQEEDIKADSACSVAGWGSLQTNGSASDLLMETKLEKEVKQNKRETSNRILSAVSLAGED
ncbi:coiled-coil domain-containing 8-like protein [Labeo rohita]|uniref:Coiled-coil domain-containing 8-like protein n=1 Tax=Labeo rohita TaxID=84645 RepID=A0A498MRI7_LABRO|nr:coiled-coil domain-containing 8-like protein [Labeo rohita]